MKGSALATLLVGLSFFLQASVCMDGVKKLEKDLAPFQRLTLNGNFGVILIQGKQERVILEGREATLAEIDIIERDGHVTIGPEREFHVKGLKKVSVTIYYHQLAELELNGINNLDCRTPIRGERLDLQCNGIRDMELHVEMEELTCIFNGIGTAFLYGTATYADIEYHGIGNLEGFDLVTDRLDLESSGIGRVEVHARKELHVDASGIGSVRYLGDPPITRLDGSGIGNIKAVRL